MSFFTNELELNRLVFRILQETQKNIFILGTATTPHEATLLDNLGVDAIVAQGFEAGGHRGTFAHQEETAIGLFSLIPQVKAATKLPVIAAGGIANSAGIKAAMTLGADACQLGTAFLCCDESGASEMHKQKIVSTAAHETELTKAFSGKYARAIKNQFTQDMQTKKKHCHMICKIPLHVIYAAPQHKQKIVITFLCGQGKA